VLPIKKAATSAATSDDRFAIFNWWASLESNQAPTHYEKSEKIFLLVK
jgi:hypothetical protein